MTHKEFKELKKAWDKKLAQSGFNDIEQDEDHLKTWSAKFKNRYHNQETLAAKEEYYRLAGHFLHDHRFPNKVERRIWELHTEGMSIRDIVLRLDEQGLWFEGGHKAHKRRVHETLQHLKVLMMRRVKRNNERSPSD